MNTKITTNSTCSTCINCKNNKKQYVTKQGKKKVCIDCLYGECKLSYKKKQQDLMTHHSLIRIKPDLTTFLKAHSKLYEWEMTDNQEQQTAYQYVSKKVCISCILHAIDPKKYKCKVSFNKKRKDKKFIHFLSDVTMTKEDLDEIILKIKEMYNNKCEFEHQEKDDPSKRSNQTLDQIIDQINCQQDWSESDDEISLNETFGDNIDSEAELLFSTWDYNHIKSPRDDQQSFDRTVNMTFNLDDAENQDNQDFFEKEYQRHSDACIRTIFES